MRSATLNYDDLNEDSDHYSLSIDFWDPDAYLAGDTLISHHTCLSVQKGACIDSGSQIDISKHLEYAIAQCTTGKSVNLAGILGQSAKAAETKCGFPTVTDTGESIIFKTDR